MIGLLWAHRIGTFLRVCCVCVAIEVSHPTTMVLDAVVDTNAVLFFVGAPLAITLGELTRGFGFRQPGRARVMGRRRVCA
jgi:hypothetical protein